MASVPQRICKYPLLLREYSKLSTDAEKEHLLPAVENLNKLLDEIDKNTKVSSDFGALLEIQKKLECPKQFKLLKEGRTFKFQGEFIVCKPNQSYGDYAFLFDDILIISKLKGDLYRAKRIVELTDIIACTTIDDSDVKIKIAEVSSGMFCVNFKDRKNCSDWLKNLNEQIKVSARGEREKSFDSLNTTFFIPARRKTSLHSKSSIRQSSTAKLEYEVQKRKNAEEKVKELENEIKKLKKRLNQQNKIISTLMGSGDSNSSPIVQSTVKTTKFGRSAITPRKAVTAGGSPANELASGSSDESLKNSKSILRSVRDRLLEISDITSPRSDELSEESETSEIQFEEPVPIRVTKNIKKKKKGKRHLSLSSVTPKVSHSFSS